MARNIKLFVYPVKDIDAAKAFYSRYLGVEPYADSAYYVGFRIGDQEIGLDPHSQVGPIAYVDVDDIKASLKELLDAGASSVADIKDVGGGLLIVQVKDASGNVLGLRQPVK